MKYENIILDARGATEYEISENKKLKDDCREKGLLEKNSERDLGPLWAVAPIMMNSLLVITHLSRRFVFIHSYEDCEKYTR